MIASHKSTTRPFSKTTGTQSIHRVLSILRTVSRHNENGVRLLEISQELKLHTATVHRMLATLLEEGWVIMDPVTKAYRVGYELFALGTAARQFMLKDVFRGALERIAEQVGDATYLVIRLRP